MYTNIQFIRGAPRLTVVTHDRGPVTGVIRTRAPFALPRVFRVHVPDDLANISYVEHVTSCRRGLEPLHQILSLQRDRIRRDRYKHANDLNMYAYIFTYSVSQKPRSVSVENHQYVLMICSRLSRAFFFYKTLVFFFFNFQDGYNFDHIFQVKTN